MPYRVLVVDDSKLARMAMARALQAIQPHWVRVEAANADEAMQVVASAAVDIAILDFNMPGRDGLALAAELKALHPAMPIAVISANHQDEIVAQARAVGATFLAKPLTDPALRDFAAAALRQLGAPAP